MFKHFFKEYVPQGQGMFNEPGLVGLHFWTSIILSVTFIGIGIILLYLFGKGRKLVGREHYLLFGVFILLSGITNAIDAMSVYTAYYQLEAMFKVLTALAAVGAISKLPQAVNKVLQMKSYETLQAELAEAQEGLIAARSRQVLINQISEEQVERVASRYQQVKAENARWMGGGDTPRTERGRNEW